MRYSFHFYITGTEIMKCLVLELFNLLNNKIEELNMKQENEKFNSHTLNINVGPQTLRVLGLNVKANS